jgi:hypothetical protein
MDIRGIIIRRVGAYLSLPAVLFAMVLSLTYENTAIAASTVPSVSVGKQPTCAWVLSGVSSNLSLTASGTYNPDTATAFTGTDSTASMYVSGDASVGTACNWFGVTKNAAIDISIPSNSGFTASPTGLGFSFSLANPLTYSAARGTGCPVGATFTTTPLSLYGTSSSGTAISYSTSGGGTTTAACLFTPAIASRIPAGLTPGGETSVLTGGTITTTLTIS